MAQQVPLPTSARADNPDNDAARDDKTHEIAPDIGYLRLAIVNAILFGTPGAGDRQWVLIDTGLPGMAGRIVDAANRRFGRNARPAAIVLTHGHIDHVGTVEELSSKWDVPVFAHYLEHPYLNGAASYPPPDPSVGGGLMSLTSPLFPRGPANVATRLHAMPDDGTIPFMPGWRWLHTPGHTVGHISLWREADRALIVGDAFVTTAQESVYAAATQHPEMHGPPMYFTHDWENAKSSIERLANLEPEVVVTGHGRAMRGHTMRSALHTLARNFDRIAVPSSGKYVGSPATVESGAAYVEVNKR